MRPILIFCLVILSTLLLAQNPDWKIVHPAPHSNELSAFQYLEKQNIIFVLGEASTLMKSTDGGDSWQTTFNIIEEMDFAYDLHFFDEMQGLVSGQLGVYTTINGGDTWTLNSLDGGTGYFEFLDRDKGYLLLPYEDLIHKTIDGGESWTTISLPDDMRDGHVTSEGNLFIITGDGTYISENGGDSFELLSNINAYHITSYASKIYAVERDKLMTSVDVGKTWTTLSELPTSFEEIFIGDEMTGFMLTGGRIFSSIDGFQTWVETDLDGYFNTIEKGADDSYFLVGEGGEVLKSTDNGESWDLVSLESSCYDKPMFHLCMDGQVGLAVGGSLYYTENGGDNWEDINASEELVSSQAGFTFTHRLNDGSWLVAGTGIGNLSADRSEFVFYEELLYIVLSGWSDGNRFFLVGIDQDFKGVTLYSEDGKNFSEVDGVGVPDKRLRYIDFDDSGQVGLIVGDSLQTYLTKDGGDSWSALDIPLPESSSGAQYYAQVISADTFFIYQNSDLLRTYDGGANFEVLEFSNLMHLEKDGNGVLVGDGIYAKVEGYGDNINEFIRSGEGPVPEIGFMPTSNQIYRIFTTDDHIFLLGDYCTVVKSTNFFSMSTSTVSVNDKRSEVSISPNPFIANLKVELPLDLDLDLIKISNVVGQEVFSLSLDKQSSVNMELPSGLPSGLYIIEGISKNHEKYLLGKALKVD